MRIDKGIRDFPFNEANPFMANLLVPRRKKNIAIANPKDRQIVDKFTGEVLNDALFIGVKKDVDEEQFVKIFQSQLQTIFDLSKSALKVLSYLMSISSYHDKIIFNYTDCVSFTGYTSKETIGKGIAELLDRDIIAKAHTANVYFINPSVFYKGDRIVLITEYRKKRIKESIDPNQLSLF